MSELNQPTFLERKVVIDTISQQVRCMLDNELSIDDFGDWVLRNYGRLFIDGLAHPAKQFVGFVLDQVTLFDVDEIDEETLKSKLAHAIANPSEFYNESSK